MRKTRTVATALIIDQRNRFLLQQRDEKPDIVFPGWISLFGGHSEGSETFLECVVREIQEELCLRLPPDRFQSFMTYRADTDDENIGLVHNEIFLLRNVPIEHVYVTEGTLKVVELADAANLEKLVPSTRLAIAKYLSGQHS